jgi:FAD:protein FMN transferase
VIANIMPQVAVPGRYRHNDVVRWFGSPIGWLGLAAALAACSDVRGREDRQRVTAAHRSMGSDVQVTAWTTDAGKARTAIAAAFAEFDRLDQQLSVWKPGSDVLRLNAAAGESPVAVGDDTRAVLRAGRQVSDWTDGKFDVTFGALAEIWKFDHDQDNRVPAAVEIRTRLPLVDFSAVRMDDPPGTAFITRPGVRVHLGGIGKGYAVDRAVAILRGAGLTDFMVQAGGDLYVAGRAQDGPWRLGINDPRGAPGESFATVELRDRTFSTSGDYERFFIHEGRRYHHLIDPDRGEPARGCVSVTIVAGSATLADGLSTGVFILGPQAGMALVERLPDVEAVIVTADNDVLISSGLQERIVVHRSPTSTRP